MKKIIFFVSIFLIVQMKKTSGQSQLQGRIKYQLNSATSQKKDSRQIEMYYSVTDFFYSYVDRRSLDIKIHNFGNGSNSVTDDSRREAAKAAIEDAPSQIWYANTNDNFVSYSVFDATQKIYCVKDTLQLVSWSLSEDTMTIKSLKCFGAKGVYMGFDYTAWYCPSIPSSAAPLYFRGLPGLLISVKNNKTGAELTVMDLEWPLSPEKNLVKQVPCSPERQISKQEFSAILNKQNDKAAEIIKQLNDMKEKEKLGIKTEKKISDIRNGNF